MRRLIPTMSMLQCFEATARFGSLTRAADELALTHSAVSRSIQSLETFLGLELFRRSKQRVYLTDAGKRYAEAVAELLGRLEIETASLVARAQADPVLNLAIYPTFGSRWLMPRLGRFTARHEEIRLSFRTGVTQFNVHSGDIDIAIQHGTGNWHASQTVKLCDEHLIVVSASRDGDRSMSRPDQIFGHTLLTLKSRPLDWSKWFDHNGLTQPEGHRGPVFETFGLLIGAVRAGLGVALVPSLYAEDDIRGGLLKQVFGAQFRSGAAFYAVCDEARAGERKLRCFMDWLADEARVS